MKTNILRTILFVSPFLASCSADQGLMAIGTGSPAYMDEETRVDLPPGEPLAESDQSKEPVAPSKEFSLNDFVVDVGLCSDLPFKGVMWPNTLLNRSQLKAFVVGLNLTGSFEGHSGWSNLTNNFDGQGLSMGLFNQTLGTGSLQPLMLKTEAKYPGRMARVFATTRYRSLRSMLEGWRGSALGLSAYNIEPMSRLDMESERNGIYLLGQTANQKSVQWAVNTLYTGSKFKSEWKSELTTLLSIPEYILVQMDAALNIHRKAMGYMADLNFKSSRAYLFFLDIVVQNGGLWSSDIKTFMELARKNPSWSEQRLLLELLEIRLTHVKKQWRTDVRERKTSIIQGRGKVHGATRNYPSEYCFSLAEPVDAENIGSWD